MCVSKTWTGREQFVKASSYQGEQSPDSVCRLCAHTDPVTRPYRIQLDVLV
jgi:hypothetical protein